MRRFELVEGTSSKFWEVEVQGTDVTTWWGRIGTAGQSKTKSFPSATKAQAEHDALVKEKTGKGYVEVAVGAARPVPPPTPPSPPPPSPPSPPLEDEPEVQLESVRKRAHPRRASGLSPLKVDASAAFVHLRDSWALNSGAWKASPSASDPATAGALRAIRERFGREVPLEPLPQPAEPELEGIALHVLAYRHRWEHPNVTDEIAAWWLGTRGVAFATETLLESISWVVTAAYTETPAVEPLDASTAQRKAYVQHFTDGQIGPYYLVRRALAGCREAAWAEARAVASTRRRTTAERLVAAYLFPEETSWGTSVTRELLDGPPGSWLGSAGRDPIRGILCTFLADGGLLLDVVKSVTTSWGFGPVVSGYGRDLGALAASMVEGAGTAAGPALLKLHEVAASASEKRDVLAALSCIGTTEVLQALFLGLSDRDTLAAAAEAARRFPARALRTLLELRARDAGGEPLKGLLLTQVRQSMELAGRLLPGLPEGQRRALESVLEKAVPRASDAREEDLPPVLRRPPWLEKRVAATVPALSLSPIVEGEELLFAPGQREELRKRDDWRTRDIRPGDDAAVLSWMRLESLIGRPSLDPEEICRESETFQGGQRESVVLTRASERVALALWEGLPSRVWSPWTSHDAFLATFGLAAVRGLVRIVEETPLVVLPLLPAFRSPRLAPAVALTFRRLKKGRQEAARWLLQHAEAAALGLIPAALAPEDERQRAASDAIRFLDANGRASTLDTAAARYGPEAVTALRAVRDFDPLLLLPARVPKLPAFFTPGAFTRPVLRNGKGAVPVAALEPLGTMLAFSKADEPYAGIAQVKEACDPRSLAAFAWDLFQAWSLAGTPSKEGWAFTALGLLGDDDTARRLSPLIREWPGQAAHARAVAGLDILEAIGTDVALMHLNGIAQKVKFKGLQDHAKVKIGLIAEKRGLSVDELADRLVPDLGLGDDGSLTLDFGPRAFRVGFDEMLKPFVREAGGKRLPDLPKPGKSDDAEKSAAAQEAWKALKKDMKALAAQQILRLELAMCGRRRFPADVYRTFFLEHPLMQHLVRRLVWGAYVEDGTLVGTFRLAEDGTLANEEDEPFTLPSGASVGIVHALELSPELAGRWGQVLGDYEILQPFRQLSRETFTPTAEERSATALKRLAGVKVPTGKVLGLEQRGWRRGAAQDGGVSGWCARALDEAWSAFMLLDPGIIAGMPMEFPEQQIESVVVERAGKGWPEKGELPLGELDPILFSEIVRDLESLR